MNSPIIHPKRRWVMPPKAEFLAQGCGSIALRQSTHLGDRICSAGLVTMCVFKEDVSE